jgi:Flp pilus assembly protein TadD
VVTALLLFLAAAPTFDESFRSGLLALQRNDLPAAQSNLETAAKLAPTNGRVWVALSQTYWKLHETTKAEAAANKATQLAPNDPAVLQSLAIFYFETAQPLLEHEKFAEAIAILEAAKAKLGSNAQLELALGVAYYGLRRFDDAAAAFLRTIAAAPELDQPYVFLGKMLDEVPNRLPEITARFEAYEAAHPASYTGYLLHAKALNAQSLDPETAAALLRKSITLNDGDASAHFELATLLDRKQQFADAAREFERAAALDPSDPATHYRLARVYDRLGQHTAAQAERDQHAKLVQAQDVKR